MQPSHRSRLELYVPGFFMCGTVWASNAPLVRENGCLSRSHGGCSLSHPHERCTTIAVDSECLPLATHEESGGHTGNFGNFFILRSLFRGSFGQVLSWLKLHDHQIESDLWIFLACFEQMSRYRWWIQRLENHSSRAWRPEVKKTGCHAWFSFNDVLYANSTIGKSSAPFVTIHGTVHLHKRGTISTSI